MSDPVTRANPPAVLARAGTPGPGRVSILALAGMFAGALPLPIVPGRMLKRVRGALVHDVAARHGLSLTPEARAHMAEPSRTSRNGALLATAAFIARRSLRRLGALGLLPPITAWLEIYALGHLFDRYLARARASQTVRIDEGEASTVRKAVDLAVKRALSPSLSLTPRGPETAPSEELRDMPTRVIDGILLFAAALPQHVQRRLETAFDLVLAEERAKPSGPRHG
jgi:hypothetical protein